MWPGKEEKNVFISTLSLLPDVSVMFGKQDVIHNKITVSQDLKKGKKDFSNAHSFTNKLTLSLSSSLLLCRHYFGVCRKRIGRAVKGTSWLIFIC